MKSRECFHINDFVIVTTGDDGDCSLGGAFDRQIRR